MFDAFISYIFSNSVQCFFSKKLLYISEKKQVEELFYEIKKNYSDDENEIRLITQYAENAYNITIEIFDENGLIYWSRGDGILVSQINYNEYNEEAKAEISSRVEMQLRPPPPHFSEMQFKPPPQNISERPPLPPPNISPEHIVLAGKFEYDGDTRYIRILSFVESIDESVRTLTMVNTFISGFILFFGIIGAILFARYFSRPVQSIQNVARNVAHLNFEARADENISTLELRDLSCNINTMADRLNGLISDLRASNEKLKADIDYQMRLDKMRREFVANVSHELKTPLHLLLMYAENLKNNVATIDKDYYCNTIIDEANRMNDMVKNLLNLSAIENELAKMNKEKFNFSVFCKNLISKTEVLLKNLDVCIHIEKQIYIDGDNRFMEQAINNYITNAVSHTPVIKGHISIELIRQGNQAVFSVYNEGSPIEAEDIPHLLESFYKTDKARVRTAENNTGLGLHIVKTIVEAHGGDYGVKNIENGVEFWFSLAIAET